MSSTSDASGRHVETIDGEQLTVFRLNGAICLARGRQALKETVRLSVQAAYDLGGRLIDEADFEFELAQHEEML